MMAPHGDPAWLARGACRRHPEVVFFSAEGEAQREAIEVCAVCPVRAICLDYALAGRELGIWGGTTERARARMRRSARRARVGALNEMATTVVPFEQDAALGWTEHGA